MSTSLNTDELIYAYSIGFFPMADTISKEIYWHCPDPRAIFPIYEIKPSRSTRKAIKKAGFTYTVNNDFESVVRKCGDRSNTWITEEIIDSYVKLNREGFAQSVETWQDDKLVGGLYGVTLGAAFFGESMFSAVSEASKGAFYFLVERLKERNYLLLDSQYINYHTKMLGAVEVSKKVYFHMLNYALKIPCKFD